MFIVAYQVYSILKYWNTSTLISTVELEIRINFVTSSRFVMKEDVCQVLHVHIFTLGHRLL